MADISKPVTVHQTGGTPESKMRLRVPKIVRTALIGAVAGLFATLNSAQAQAQDNEWQYAVAPYLWASGVSGNTAVVPGLPPVNVDAKFKDIAKSLDMGGMLAFSASKGKFGVFGDIQYIDLGGSAPTPGPAFSGVGLSLKLFIATVGGEVLVSKSATSELRLLGGARYWDVDSKLSFAGGVLPARTVTGGNDWWDGVVGVRGTHDIAPKTYLTGWAMLGAGGSDHMVDVFGGLGFRVTDKTSLIGGYRYVSVDRQDGAFLYDVEQQGLIFGAKFTF